MEFSFDNAKEWFTEFFEEEGDKLISFCSLEYPGLCSERFYLCRVLVPDEGEGYTCTELWHLDTSSEIHEPDALLSCRDIDSAELSLLNIIYDELKMFLELQASRRRKFRGV